MKHLSLLLTVLILGAVPLAAAALDYGPNRTLLAAENGAPQLPRAQAHAASTGAMPKPDIAGAGADDASIASPAMPQAASASPLPVAARPGQGPSASNTPRSSRTARPAAAPSPASWQSLLPGSIQ